MLRTAIEAKRKGPELDLSRVLPAVVEAVRAAAGGTRFRLSWRSLMQEKPATPDDRRRFVLVEPRLDYGQLYPGTEPIAAVRRLAREAGLTGSGGARLR